MIHTKNSFATSLTKFASETKSLSSPHMCKVCTVPQQFHLWWLLSTSLHLESTRTHTHSHAFEGFSWLDHLRREELQYILDTVSSSSSYKRTWKQLLLFVCCACFQWQVHLSSYWCIPSLVWELLQDSSINWRHTETICFVDWTTIRFFSFLLKTIKKQL